MNAVNDVSGFLEAERWRAWGKACAAQLKALELRTTVAWADAARAWDLLASLYPMTYHDRAIFADLAKDNWYRVIGHDPS